MQITCRVVFIPFRTMFITDLKKQYQEKRFLRYQNGPEEQKHICSLAPPAGCLVELQLNYGW